MDKGSFGSEEKETRNSQTTGVGNSSAGNQAKSLKSTGRKVVIVKSSIEKLKKSPSTKERNVVHYTATEKSDRRQKSRTNKKEGINPFNGSILNTLKLLLQQILTVLASLVGKGKEKSALTDKKTLSSKSKMVGGETSTPKSGRKSIWIKLGVCGGCVVMVVVLFTLLKGPDSDSHKKLNLKRGDVYYTSTVTQEEAEKLGRYLVRTDFFAREPHSILYNKNGNINEFKINVKDSAVMKPIDPDVCRQITRDLSQDVFGGAPVNVHLTDSEFNTVWVINQAASFGKKLVFNGGDLYFTSTVTPESAKKVGNYLVKSNFFDGSSKSALLNRTGDIHEFKISIKTGAEDDPNILAAGTQLISDLSKDIFDGSQVNVYLTDNEFKTLKVLVQKDNASGKSENVAVESFTGEDILNDTIDKGKTTGSVNVIELTNSLKSYDPVERALAAVSLGEVGSQAAPAVDTLIRLVADYEKLTKKGPYDGKWPVYVDGNIELNEYPTHVDKVAAWSLAEIGEVAVDPLVTALNHEDWRIQRYAAKILGKIGAVSAEKALIAALNDKNWLVQEDAILALKKITGKDTAEWQRGKATVEPLISALDAENVRVKWDVIKALGKLKDPRALDPLVDILNQRHGDPILQELALESIGELNDKRAISSIIGILNNKYVSASLQELAVKILGNFRDDRAVESIITAMKSPQIKDEAALALSKITGKDFGEDVTKWHTWNQQLKNAEMEKHNYADGIHSDSANGDSIAFNEIAKVHPDYLEVVNNQMFTDYVNNLPPEKYKVANRIVESGSIDDVINLITVYRKQVDNQNSHRLMIKRMITNHINQKQKGHVDKVVENWTKESGELHTIIKWNIKKIYEERFLVDYVVNGASYEQKFLYEVDMGSDAVNRVWEQDSNKSPHELAIKMVKESYILDNQNKTKTKHVIMDKKDEIGKNYSLIGWGAEKIKDQTFLVSYTYEKDSKEDGWFFEVDLNTLVIRHKNVKPNMNR